MERVEIIKRLKTMKNCPPCSPFWAKVKKMKNKTDVILGAFCAVGWLCLWVYIFSRIADGYF